jgi:hypothetical protein
MTETIGMSHPVQSELGAMRDVLGLVAFAVEARRVLQAIDAVADVMPLVDEALSNAIDVRRQWTEFPDTAAAVLASVHWRLEELLMKGAES